MSALLLVSLLTAASPPSLQGRYGQRSTFCGLTGTRSQGDLGAGAREETAFTVFCLTGSDHRRSNFNSHIAFELDAGVGLGTGLIDPATWVKDEEGHYPAVNWMFHGGLRAKVAPLHYVTPGGGVRLAGVGGVQLRDEGEASLVPKAAWVLGAQLSGFAEFGSATLTYLWQPMQGEHKLVSQSASLELTLGWLMIAGKVRRDEVTAGRVDSLLVSLGVAMDPD